MINVQLKVGSAAENVEVNGRAPSVDLASSTLNNSVGGLDSYGRPTALYGQIIHENCPRREHEEASRYGQDNRCLEELGCKGPNTRANCYSLKWNNGQNWCIDANAQCLGCVNSNFPGTGALRRGHDD